MPVFVSEKGHPGASRTRNWTGEGWGREPRQKAGSEIQGAAGGQGAGFFVRHLGSKAARNEWRGEGSQGGLFGFWLSQLCGWRCHPL